MTMPDDVDVLIAGGGPAGLSAGIVLAQRGLRTVVCERGRYPVDKVCGEGIMPAGVADFRRLGIAPFLPSESYYPFRGIRYHSHKGCVAAADFIEGPGWGVHRPILSQALRLRVQEFPLLEIRQEMPIHSFTISDGRLLVQTGDHDRIRTRLLIGADGLNSRIRRQAGLDGPAQRLKRWGARRHFHIAPWSDYVEVHWGQGIEAYITPCGPALVEVAFLWDRARYRSVSGGSGHMRSLMRAFPDLSARLDGVSSPDAGRTVGPLSRRAKAPVGDGVLLIGDAAGYLDAITGEGISLATAQALALEETVIPLLMSPRRNLLTAKDLAPYADAYHVIVRPYYTLTRWVLFMSHHPALAERAIRSLEKQPAVFQTLLSVNMGHVPPWGRVAGSVMRLIGGMV